VKFISLLSLNSRTQISLFKNNANIFYWKWERNIAMTTGVGGVQENGARSRLSSCWILASQCPAQLGSSGDRGWAWEPGANARFCTNILLCYMDYLEHQLPLPLRHHLAAMLSASLHVSMYTHATSSFTWCLVFNWFLLLLIAPYSIRYALLYHADPFKKCQLYLLHLVIEL
jgi:hypothetical protein